jgi:uncharacterized protein (TIGR00255 family)
VKAALASMTGYARAAGEFGGVGFACEIRSVNARGLDIRMRLAPGLDALESELRRRIAANVTRGALTVTLSLDADGSGAELVVNERALETALAAIARLSGRITAAPPSLDGILAIPGVLDRRETPRDAEAESALHAAILACADACLAELVAARQREGAELAAVLSRHIDEIATLADRAERHPARDRASIAARLSAQIAELGAVAPALSEERLAQEALLLATKADIREELDRLAAHVTAARELIAKGGAVGRKLDFLSQEFNREANTLCAKSNSVELTAIGLDLKAVIDQLREQVQNIE